MITSIQHIIYNLTCMNVCLLQHVNQSPIILSILKIYAPNSALNINDLNQGCNVEKTVLIRPERSLERGLDQTQQPARRTQ